MLTIDNAGASSSWWQTDGVRLRKTQWSQAVDVTTCTYRSDIVVCKLVEVL